MDKNFLGIPKEQYGFSTNKIIIIETEIYKTEQKKILCPLLSAFGPSSSKVRTIE